MYVPHGLPASVAHSVLYLTLLLSLQAEPSISSHHGTRFCRNWNLTPEQIELCVHYKEHMPSMGYAAREAIKQCRNEFKYRRWNCTVPGRHPLFERLDTPNKESAFTYAITAAAVVHQIARACAADEIQGCECAKPAFEATSVKRQDCSDNVGYAIKFAKDFLDSAGEAFNPDDKPKRKSRVLMNLHNNDLGRKIVQDTMKETCKCHGVSGSCSLKTCWDHVAPMQMIASELTDKYDAAIQVKLGRKDDSPALIKVKNRRSGRFPGQDHMVYVTDSPDYCEMDTKKGFPGTMGRVCQKNHKSTNFCPTLCCDRGYNVIKKTEISNCKCKFIFCCRVKCEKCKTTIEEAVCK